MLAEAVRDRLSLDFVFLTPLYFWHNNIQCFSGQGHKGTLLEGPFSDSSSHIIDMNNESETKRLPCGGSRGKRGCIQITLPMPRRKHQNTSALLPNTTATYSRPESSHLCIFELIIAILDAPILSRRKYKDVDRRGRHDIRCCKFRFRLRLRDS